MDELNNTPVDGVEIEEQTPVEGQTEEQAPVVGEEAPVKEEASENLEA
jgi:hypothetical protein